MDVDSRTAMRRAPRAARKRVRVAIRLLVSLSLVPWPAFALGATSCAAIETRAMALVDLRDSDPAQGVARGDALLADVRALPSPCAAGEAMVLGSIATNLNVLGRHAESVRHYEQAIATLATGTPAQMAFLHRGLGVALVELESYETALRHYLLALAASDGAGDDIGSAKTSGNIGNLYTSLGELDQARDAHRRSLRGFEAAGFAPGIAGALVNLGSVAAKAGLKATDAGDAAAARREHVELRDHNRRARALFAELGNLRGVAYADSNIGLALDRLGRPARALRHYQDAVATQRKVGDLFGTINSLLGIASAQAHLGQHGAVAEALDEVEALLPADAFNLHAELASRRVLLAETQGDYPAALAAQRELGRLASLAADAEQRTAIAALQDRFDRDKAEREIESLRAAAEVSGLRLQRQRQVSLLGILAALLASGLLLVLWNRYRVGVSTSRRLSVAARTDHLTGLPNRRHLVELMQHEVRRVERGTETFCLLMADLDDFKAVNDRHGHDAGDAVLREVARRLRDAVRGQDWVARWGGEEFLLLLPESRGAGAALLADKLRRHVAAEPIATGVPGGVVTVTLTLGCSEFRPGQSLDDCIKAADAALYQGKHAGKDQVAGFADAGLLEEPAPPRAPAMA